MHALVVYESMFGNTRDVALAIAEGLSSRFDVESVEVGQAPVNLDGVDLLVAGAPTHAFGMSRAKSRLDAAKQAPEGLVSAGIGLREWFDRLEAGQDPPAGAAFDTILAKPGFLKLFAWCARGIEKRMRRRGMLLARRGQHFKVTATKGPLAEGELERARAWGEQLARSAELGTAGAAAG
ncbi:MAG: flavodoxin domain-containing protein [Dehalococcoidia bacterium]